MYLLILHLKAKNIKGKSTLTSPSSFRASAMATLLMFALMPCALHNQSNGRDLNPVSYYDVSSIWTSRLLLQGRPRFGYLSRRSNAFRSCASLDGDADRLRLFPCPIRRIQSIDLINGDKILSLFALFEKMGTSEYDYSVKLGIVQTAYANGVSTDYLKELGMEVESNFEANGHGTILFSKKFLKWLEAKIQGLAASSEMQAAQRLLAASNLINQAIRDSLSGMILVEVVLCYMELSIQSWKNLYQDLPTKYSQGRAFVRPSGTEDVIRVYAEASTQQEADTLSPKLLLNMWVSFLVSANTLLFFI
ncbi:hypothetical protein AMTRI_Chr09g40290 [Amborella trichopoda]